ncbi:MFS transporter [Mucilaginibacter sp. AW1-7]|jgi:MFS family permease|uniref:MFS transporter n=1 Tax=Mucilaginibacter ginsenosidivorax TaxID=862126 RepID=A0A5B8VXC9_9SPHI|nr:MULTISPECIES: MFS transporter [Mucilaginibacter]QEC74908.1 MFS transporter [Mucilaginibacter ginsenosidivorax]WDF80225.1 MFS transporter [Mucilaginibacter sp. KACC 22773]
MQTINRTQLFRASCLSLLVTSLSFGIRAGILGELGTKFALNASQLGTITATAFWGFPLAVVIGGIVVDIIGMKRLLLLAFIFHLTGILLTIFATGYWTLFFSTLVIGIANGTVEAACNPLVTSLYTENKTTKLSHFHLWFPGGIVIGTLIVTLFKLIGLNWQVQVGVMLIPTAIYGYLFSKLDFPVTERVASGVSTAGMYKAVASPLFIFMFICMFGTAITELFTGQWIDVLLKNVTDNALLLLTLETGVMVLGRAFAKPVLKLFSPQVVILMSTIVASIGLFMLSTMTGDIIFLAAIIFGMGVCFFWPTMLGFVSENIPKSGALGLNLMGGAGMFAVSIWTIIMGKYYDNIVASKMAALPAGTDPAKALETAKSLAGPDVLHFTLTIPLVLIVAFTGLVFYMRAKKKTAPLSQVTV